VKDATELSQELQTILDVDDDIKVFVNVSGERVLDVGNLDIKFDKISIQRII